MFVKLPVLRGKDGADQRRRHVAKGNPVETAVFAVHAQFVHNVAVTVQKHGLGLLVGGQDLFEAGDLAGPRLEQQIGACAEQQEHAGD